MTGYLGCAVRQKGENDLQGMNKIKSVGSWIAGIILFTVFCCVATVADSSGDPKPAGVDSAQFADFMAGEALDIQDLAEGAEIQRRIF